MLFLDEPTTGLDPNARAMMWEIVRGLAADGTTVLLTTQYLEEADQLAGRVAVIDGGTVIAEGTPGELKAVGRRRAPRGHAGRRRRTSRPPSRALKPTRPAASSQKTEASASPFPSSRPTG